MADIETSSSGIIRIKVQVIGSRFEAILLTSRIHQMTWKINNSFFPQPHDNSLKDCDPAIVLSTEQIQFATSPS